MKEASRFALMNAFSNTWRAGSQVVHVEFVVIDYPMQSSAADASLEQCHSCLDQRNCGERGGTRRTRRTSYMTIRDLRLLPNASSRVHDKAHATRLSKAEIERMGRRSIETVNRPRQQNVFSRS